jgi:hypothetical protein
MPRLFTKKRSMKTMTSPQITTKTNHRYFRALAALTLVASFLPMVAAAKTTHAPFFQNSFRF